ncbi:Myb-like protein P [Tanacetum coccineum]
MTRGANYSQPNVLVLGSKVSLIGQPYVLLRMKPSGDALTLWSSLEDLFHDNKEARAMELHEELRSMELGDLSIAEYFKRIKVIADLLTNIDLVVDEKNLVMHAVNGLGDKYDHVASIIRHSKNPLTLLETRSMLLLETASRIDTMLVAHLPVLRC